MGLFPIGESGGGEEDDHRDGRGGAADAGWLRLSSYRKEEEEEAPARASASDLERYDERSNTSASASSSSDRKRRDRKKRSSDREKSSKKRHKKSSKDSSKRRRLTDAEKIAAIEERFARHNSDSRKGDAAMWVGSRLRDAKNAYEDVRADGDNLAYGKLARSDVLKFSRALDQARAWYITAGKTRKSPFFGTVLTDKKRDKREVRERYFTRAGTTRTRDRDTFKFHRPMDPDVAKEQAEYLALQQGDKVSKEVTHGMESVHAYLTRKTKAFNEDIRQRPHDAQLWREFAKFQDQFMALTKKRSEAHQIIEKKVTILEHALRYHPNDGELIVMLLKEREKLEDRSTTEKRWRYACDNNAGNPTVWREFLKYRKGDFVNFSVAELEIEYKRALRALAAAHSEATLTKKSSVAKLEEAMVDFVIDYCTLVMQSGETERAVAKLQAALEFGCLSPTQGSEADLLDSFESFWECEEPRVGEPNATGWGDWLTMNEAVKSRLRDNQITEHTSDHTNLPLLEVPPPPPKPPSPLRQDFLLGGGWATFDAQEEQAASVETDDGEADNDDFVEANISDEALLARLEQQLDGAADIELDDSILDKWIEKEWERSLCDWRPARLMELEDDGDVKSIGFDDIRDGLIRFTDPSARNKLWVQVLRLVGALEILPSDFASDSQFDALECASGVYAPATQLFATKCAKSDGDSWLNPNLGLEHAWQCGSSGRGALGANMLRVVSRRDPTVFSFKMVQTQDEAKSLLATSHGESLALWAHLGEMEWKNGRKSSARKIFSRAFDSAVKAQARDISQLALSWVESESSSKSNDGNTSALKILTSLANLGTTAETSPEDAKVDDERLAKAGALLEKKALSAVNGGTPWTDGDGTRIKDDGVASILCYAWFQMITRQSTAGISSMLQNVPKATQRDEKCASLWHSLYLKLLRMIPVTARRKTLELALGVFPSSPSLLLSLCELELEVHGKQRMHRYLDVEFETHPTVTLVFFGLGLEVDKGFPSNPRAISILERALDPSSPARRSPLLWLTYMHAYVVSRQIASAKTIFLRAINAVPWNKTIWLYGLQHMKGALTAKERGALIDVMREKGVNIRVDMYEVQLEAAIGK
jgi:hypothetical protein